MDGFNAELAIKNQAQYCKDKGAPHFAPESGRCWSCRRNIYEPIGWKNIKSDSGWVIRSVETKIPEEIDFISGIKPEQAASKLITGCPHCNRSYCD